MRSRTDRSLILWASSILLSALLLLGSGCGGSEEPRTARAAVEAEDGSPSVDSAAADSSAVPDSAAAPPKKGGFLARILGRNKEKPDEKEEETVPVELVEASRRDLPSYLAATATLEPEKQADVLAKIDGTIERILVEEGDWVREGQILAVLDGAAQRVALEETEARSRALSGDLERAEALHRQEFASDKDLHDARSAFEQAFAQRKGAELRLSYTEIRAPFAGRVARRLVDPGRTVAAGAALFTLMDTDPLLASIFLPESEAARLSPGQKVTVRSDRDGGEESAGEVLRIAPIVDSRTGTIKVTCRVSGGNEALRPGSFVRVKVEIEIREDVLVIPKRALVPEGSENYVFRADGDSVVKIPVLVGRGNDTLVEISGGLVPGDRLVSVGQGALKSGSRIREVKGRGDGDGSDEKTERADTTARFER